LSTQRKSSMKETHVFDAKNIAVLESEDRKTWQNVDEILGLIELKQNYLVADLGCGSGYFTIPISYKVKKIYGIDVQREMLDFLEQKINRYTLGNIELLLSKDDKIPLDDESMDLLITINTLHEFRTKEKVIEEIQRVLKTGGKAIVIDFKKKNMDFGPPPEIRISKIKAKQLFEEKGFKFVKSHELLYHYLIIFRKK
jgi:ubiquinone/menaquinone biosynthesis C-methylase UbiE